MQYNMLCCCSCTASKLLRNYAIYVRFNRNIILLSRKTVGLVKGCIVLTLAVIITLAASNAKRNVKDLPPFVRLSVPSFSILYRARGAHSTRLTKGQHATRPAYISVRVYYEDGHTCLLLINLLTYNIDTMLT